MKAIELIGDVDREHRLQAQVPKDLPAGPVRVLVLVPEPDQADQIWMRAVASEWAEELSDPRQDLYTLEDGQPLDGAR
jgi:hypothetical protein